MSSVDQRVVQMQFDNKQFESGVKQTLTSLESLKKGLNLTEASKSFDEINKKANNTKFDNLRYAVESVRDRFNAMGIVGITVLQNITNAAWNTGTAIAKALTIQPLLDGLQEYELQMNSVQTILANTQKEGTNITQVNSALDTLNTYADKTIYNFSEMTRNIGTFTAAGVNLQTSVDSIQGIANLAAVSGSSSQQASTAMYQLSQAIAAGTVKLMDWNSVVNAGMGGAVFQDALIRTSEHLQTGAKAAIEANGSFRESLSTGWLTTEVLTETLKQFSLNVDTAEDYEKAMADLVAQGYTQEEAKNIVDMAKTAGEAATKVKTFTQLIDTLKEALGSGWAQSWRIIIGDFEQAKELWTEVSDVLSGYINDSANARNELLQSWADMGGRQAIIDGLRNAFEALLSVIKPISEGIREVFPKVTAEQLVDLSNKFKDFTASLKLSETDAANLKNIVVKLATAFKTVVGVVGTAITKFTEVVNPLGLMSTALQGVSSGLNFFGNLIGVISPLLSIFTTAISQGITNLTSSFANLTGATGSMANSLTEGFLKVLELIPTAIGTAISAIGNAVKMILEAVPISEINDALQDSLFTLILAQIAKFTKGANDAKEETVGIFDKIIGLFDGLEEAVGKFGGVLDSAKDSINSFTHSIQANIILKIAAALILLAASMKIISEIPVENLVTSLGAVAGIMAVLLASAAGIIVFLKKMQMSLKDTAQFAIVTNQIRVLATAMLLMAVSIKILTSAIQEMSQLSWEELLKGLGGVAASIALLVIALKALSNTSGIAKATVSLLAFALAIRVISSAIKTCSDLEWEGIAKGVVAVGAAVAMLVIATVALSKIQSGLVKTSLLLIVFASSIKVLASAIKDFNDIEASSVVKAAAAIVSLMVAVKLIDSAAKGMKLGKTIGTIAVLATYATVMKTFAETVKQFNDIDSGSIGKALVSMVGLFGIITAFTMAMSGKTTEFAAISGGLWAVSEAIKTFVNATQTMASLSTGDIVKGIVGIGGGVAVMLGAIRLVPEKEVVKIAASFVLLAVAMKTIASAISQLAGLSIQDVATALIALGGSLGIISVAMNALSKTKNLAQVGASLMLVGIGISMLAGPIKTFGDMDLANMAQGLIGLAASLVIVGVAASKLSPLAGQMVKTAVGLTAMAASILVFGIALTAMIYPIKSLGEMDSSQLTSGVVALAAVITTLFVMANTMNALPDFSLKTVAKVAIMSLVIAGVGAVIQQLGSLDTGAAIEGASALSMTLLSASAAIAILGLIPLPGALAALATLAVVIAGISAIVVAMGGLAQIPGAKWLVSEGKEFLQSIGEAIGSFFGGIAGGVIGGAMSAITNQLPAMGSGLADFANNAAPFFSSMESMNSGVADGVKSLAEAMLIITGAGILDAATEWLTGGSSMEEFGKQLAKFGPYFSIYAASVNGIKPEVVEASANAAKSLAEFATNIPGEGGLLQDIMGKQDIVEFGKKLAEFGPYIKQYADSVADLDGNVVEASANAAKSLAEFANNIPAQGGAWQSIIGSQDIADFGSKLASFGGEFKKYADSIAGIDPATVEASATAAKSLAELNNNLPNTGGISQWFTGSQDLGTFATRIISLGNGMKKYGEAVNGINSEAIMASVTGAKGIAEVQTALGDTGGASQWFTGSQDLGDFAGKLKTVGQGIGDYADAVNGKNFENVSASVEAAKGIAAVQTALGDTGGASQWFTGSQDLGDFAGKLKTVGQGVGDYADAVNGKNFESVGASVDALNRIKDLMNGTGDINVEGFKSMTNAIKEAGDMGLPGLNETLSTNAESVATNLEKIKNALQTASEGISGSSTSLAQSAGSINTFKDSLSGLSSVDFGAATNGVNGLTDAIQSIPEKVSGVGESVSGAMGSIASAVSGYSGSFSSAGINAANALSQGLVSGIQAAGASGSAAAQAAAAMIISTGTAALNAGVGQFQMAGRNMAEGVRGGIDQGKSAAVDAVRNLIDACKNAVSNEYGEFKRAGGYMAQGLADGISSGRSGAVNAAREIARAAVQAAKDEAQVQSPSRKFIAIGGYMSEGMMIGLLSLKKKVAQAGSDVASAAIDSASSRTASVNITPVVSSDNVGVISGLSANRTISLNAKLANANIVNPITAMQQSISMENAQVLKSNNAVTKAINDLRTDMDGYTSAITGMENAVYVDGKKLASTIAKPINQQLGILQRRGY